RGLKGLAREVNGPGLALSQVSRSIAQRSNSRATARPMLSDPPQSGATPQDADIATFVHREREESKNGGEPGAPPKPKTHPMPTEIIVAKHRNGPTGVANLMFFAEFTLFSNMARPT